MRVVVAMSGGVDSSVAAGLLVEQGHEVIGVHMKLHDASPGGPGHCCGLDDALDARRVADRLGIPFYVLNLKTAFERAVMDDLADEYLAGRTPNPCVHCNGVLKFDVLLKRALKLGATHLATGHYARIGAGPRLLAAADLDKDQSYFLFPVDPSALERTLFPLGALTKAAVRAHAERLGLVTAKKPESQDICFVPDGDHAGFVARHRPGVNGAGEIVDTTGTVLGHHDGYWRFTVGQRRGIGVALGHPTYVVRVDPAENRVVVGTEADVHRPALVLGRCNWFDRPAPGRTVLARVRHRGALHPCRVEAGEPAVLRFDHPVRAIAPGQAAVVYDGDTVLGGGFIATALDA